MKVKNELSAIIFGLLFLSVTMNASTAKAQYGDYDDNVSLETFYEELAPYGVWINDPQYGRVWRPDVDQDEFRPYYSRGHWEMTKYGNTWVSDYDWGWAPFHYGRWHHHSRRGWLWIPGREWAPAWVSWRSGGGHYGWAPLGPGININMNIGRIPDYWWVFIPQRNIYYRSYPRYDWRRNSNIYHNTVIINNIYVNNSNRNRYYTGPRADEIRRITRQPVTVHDVRNERYANGRSNRPEVNRGSVSNPRPTRPTDAGRGAVNGRTDNSIVDRSDNSSRGAVNGRPDNTLTDRSGNSNPDRGAPTNRPDRVTTSRPTEQVASRPGDQKLSGSSQRTSRTYDNQDIRGSQSPQRERQPIAERQQQQSRPEPPQRAEQRPQQQPRESTRDNSSQRSDRSSSPERSSSERSSGGARPSRGQ
ncbi:DUF6600 domain-containing protein [Daejeonella lutea]|uniref:YXWGXW repeat-containing protein n=1 Tax=Daejeonella lutea TaxID=572036 RepID=A0A1T5DAH2_9SPHI|nr:DUF6600 domain-containing protein [Daejeonella lutea]SKB68587.1 hypothetical protein SAMN05661099_2252 [Daejeonella lutea]